MLRNWYLKRIRPRMCRLIWNRHMWLLFDKFLPTPNLGQRGEREAERFLRRKGLQIVARDVENDLGEIDLIAIDHRTVVFAEVKTRVSDWAGMPAEAVDDEKQRRISRAALFFLRQNNLLEQRVRFDVLSVFWPGEHRFPLIEHYEHAFEAQGVE